MTPPDPIRLIAFYLPQFHPIPENDEWWGRGFTEWRNVVQARPLFPGHYQPHIPADLGFYDLRVPETRQAQTDLAKEYGISGFCYYHYWFNGKRLLERPFEQALESGQPEFPFCLCWANESWTRAWDGQSGVYLLKQDYSEEDDRQHIRWLIRAFRDKRYWRFEGKPMFLVYRAANLPNPLKTVEIWRTEARQAGIGELFLCQVQSNFQSERSDPAAFGFDAAVEFQPDAFNYGSPIFFGKVLNLFLKLRHVGGGYGSHFLYDYSKIVERMFNKPRPAYRWFRCVTPSWDSSARRKQNAHILVGSTPVLYEKWLRAVVKESEQVGQKENLVFINAWNEWAEGNHLEPDLRYGRAYLEATRRAVSQGSSS